jgi:F-type H+-transporting ATPase subunit epsilon
VGKTLSVRVVSPVEVVFEGEAMSIVVPAWDGKVGILPGHAPFIALLGSGTMEADLPGGGSERYFLDRGVVKVEDDRVTILSEYAGSAPPEGFDPSRAWLDLEELEAGDGPEASEG